MLVSVPEAPLLNMTPTPPRISPPKKLVTEPPAPSAIAAPVFRLIWPEVVAASVAVPLAITPVLVMATEKFAPIPLSEFTIRPPLLIVLPFALTKMPSLPEPTIRPPKLLVSVVAPPRMMASLKPRTRPELLISPPALTMP